MCAFFYLIYQHVYVYVYIFYTHTYIHTYIHEFSYFAYILETTIRFLCIFASAHIYAPHIKQMSLLFVYSRKDEKL